MTATLDSAAAPIAAAPAFGHRLAPAGDPLEGAEFDAIYDAKIQPELVKCETERRSALQTFIVALIGGGVLVFLEFLLMPSFFHGMTSPPIPLLGFTAIGAAVLGYLPLAGVAKKAKVGVITSLCEPLGISYQVSGGDPPAFATFLQLKLLPHPEDKSFQDFFSGPRGPVEFALCEATLTQGSGKERHTVFHGQIFRLTLPKKRLSTTCVLRNTGWLNRFECPSGLKPVGLEDPRFNQAFVAFGTDQVEAREILTPSFMQQLVDLESAYSAGHLRCAFIEGDVLIAFEGGDRFEIGNMFSSLVDRTRVEGIARDLEQFFKLIDEFDAA